MEGTGSPAPLRLLISTSPSPGACCALVIIATYYIRVFWWSRGVETITPGRTTDCCCSEYGKGTITTSHGRYLFTAEAVIDTVEWAAPFRHEGGEIRVLTILR